MGQITAARQEESMQLIPLRQVLAMTKDKLKETMAPIRCAMAKMQAELEKIKIDEKIMRLQTTIQDKLIEEKIDFNGLIDTLDEIALMERRKAQFDEVIAQLFPEEK
jgi:hypothetical protein